MQRPSADGERAPPRSSGVEIRLARRQASDPDRVLRSVPSKRSDRAPSALVEYGVEYGVDYGAEHAAESGADWALCGAEDLDADEGSLGASGLTRRGRLGRLVAANLAAIGVLFVVAGMLHLARSRANAANAAKAANAKSLEVSGAEGSAADSPGAGGAGSWGDPSSTAPSSATARRSADGAYPADKGAVSLDPSILGKRVSLDGHRLTTALTTVECGAHLLKVGRWGHPQSIDVPCGGEVYIRP